jgi:predicted nucleotidyltransferase
MLRTSALDALMPAARRALLAELLPEGRGLHLGELARRIAVRPSTLQRDLARLVAAGILERRRDGNRILFRADEACPFLPELRGLVRKTAGLAEVLAAALEPIAGRIRVAILFGSLARGEARSQSDVDLLVVGAATPSEVSRSLAPTRANLGREINPVVMSPEELLRLVKEKRAFPCHPLAGAKVFVLGTAHDLAKLLGTRNRRAPGARPGRAP